MIRLRLWVPRVLTEAMDMGPLCRIGINPDSSSLSVVVLSLVRVVSSSWMCSFSFSFSSSVAEMTLDNVKLQF